MKHIRMLDKGAWRYAGSNGDHVLNWRDLDSLQDYNFRIQGKREHCEVYLHEVLQMTLATFVYAISQTGRYDQLNNLLKALLCK